MKKIFISILFFIIFIASGTKALHAQCSICTKTASQLGEKPAKSLNAGILYLMATPLTVAFYIGYRWWKREKVVIESEKHHSSSDN